MYSYIPLDLKQLLDVEVDLWFQICIVDTHQRIYVMVNGLLRQLVNSFISVYATMAWYPAETNMCAFVIQQQKDVHDMANKRVLSVFTLNRLHAGHCVRVDYYIVVDWAHVLVIVQCQSDGCSLSHKDGTVVWQSFGQVAAGCLTILEMAVDNGHLPIFYIKDKVNLLSNDEYFTIRKINPSTKAMFNSKLEETNWDAIYIFNDSQLAYDVFLKMFLKIYNECFPKITVKNGYKNR